MRDYREFLDPKVVAQIQDLSLKARLIVEGFLVGLHRSPYHGFSVEFKEHRLYSPGDDLKWIDWKAYARTDRFFVKKYEEETNLKAYILFDISGSMAYPTDGLSKFEYARTLCAALSYLFYLQRDATGLVAFNDGIQTFLPPRMSKIHLYDTLTQLASLKPGGKTAPYKPLRSLAEKIKKKGMVIFISDLLTEMEPVVKTLSYLRNKGHEVIVIHVLSPEEINIRIQGPAIFRDLETGEKVPIDPTSIKSRYRKQMSNLLHEIKWLLRNRNIDYEFFSTDQDYSRALLFYLKRRERLP